MPTTRATRSTQVKRPRRGKESKLAQYFGPLAPILQSTWLWVAIGLAVGGYFVVRATRPTVQKKPDYLELSEEEQQKRLAAAEAAKKAREAAAEAKAKQVAEQKAAQPTNVAATVEPPKPAAGAGSPKPPDAAPTPPAMAETKAAEMASLPKDPTTWKDADVLAARLGGDPRLIAALQYRAERFPNEEPQAIFLAQLLAPKPSGDAKKDATPPAPMPPPVLTVVVRILASNPTAAARRILAEVLSGALGIPNDQVAVQATLDAFAAFPSDENDGALLAAATQPEKVRPTARGQVSPDMLQQLALRTIERDGKNGLRLRIAKQLTAPACPAALAQVLTPLLQQERLENLEAQVALFEGTHLEPKVQAVLDRQLLGYSHKAMLQAFGLTDNPDASKAEMTPEAVARVANLLWNSRVAAVLEEREVAMETLEQNPTTVLLAATIPTSEVRSRFARTLARHWEERPTVLMSASEPRTYLAEPGILAVFKTVRSSRPTLGRTDAKTETLVAAAGAKGGGKATYTQATSGRNRNAGLKALALNALSGDGPSRSDTANAESPWLTLEGSLVREYCRRCFAAGLSEMRARRASGRADAEKVANPSPIALHPGASPLVLYRMQWPGAFASMVPDSAREPMQITYVRVEDAAIPRAVLSHYYRAVNAPQLHPLKDGVWLDAFVPSDEGGRCRSIDVVLSRANAQSTSPADKPQELTVEILVVDIPALKSGLKTKSRAGTEPDSDDLP